METEVHYRIHNIPPLDPILSQINLVRVVRLALNMYFNIILTPHVSCKWSLASGFVHQNTACTSPACVLHATPISFFYI